MDFIDRLPPTKKGNRWLLVAIDHATDWSVLKALTEATEEAVANFLYHEILIQYGCPTEIITDRRDNFMAMTLNRYQFIIILLSILNFMDLL
jgi:diphthamide synthase subunit DPH2